MKSWRRRATHVLAASVAAAPVAAQGPLSVRSGPGRPYAEVTAVGTAVNGDLIVRNDTDEAYELVEVHLDVRGPGGALVQRKELNTNGISPSILTVPNRTVDKHGMLLVYNPFPVFDAGLRVARLDYRLVFRPVGGPDAPTTSADVRVTPRPAPDDRFTLPLGGRVLVWDGHDLYAHHRRWDYTRPALARLGYTGNAGRYAYDFIAVDEDGRRSRGDEAVNENWLSFGRRVRATFAGRVVAVHGAEPDDRTVHREVANAPNGLFGNYVLVRHADGSYSLFGHLMRGSPAVRVGDAVHAGQLVGRVGASGSSLFPHLHYQRVEAPNDLEEGVPVRWRDVRRFVATRTAAVPSGYLDTGDIVEAR